MQEKTTPAVPTTDTPANQAEPRAPKGSSPLKLKLLTDVRAGEYRYIPHAGH